MHDIKSCLIVTQMLIWRCISPDLYASNALFIVAFIEMSFTFIKKSILSYMTMRFDED